MYERLALAVAAVTLGASVFAPGATAHPDVVAHRKSTAERNILRVALRGSHTTIPMLVDARTGLLRNNVRAVCRGRGRRHSGNRYARFVCIVRPWPAAKRELLVTYHALADGRFRTRWLRVQRQK